MTPSQKPPAGARTARRRRRALRAALAVVALVSTAFAVRIGAERGQVTESARGGGIQVSTGSGGTVESWKADWTDTGSSQSEEKSARTDDPKTSEKAEEAASEKVAPKKAAPEDDRILKEPAEAPVTEGAAGEKPGKEESGDEKSSDKESSGDKTTGKSKETSDDESSGKGSEGSDKAGAAGTGVPKGQPSIEQPSREAPPTTSAPDKSTTTAPPSTAPPTTAPPSTAPPVTAPPATAPSATSPAPAPRPNPAPVPGGGAEGLAVDTSRLPVRSTGNTTQRIGQATHQPYRSDGVGAFRINCSMSHMNFDDPIVAPGRVGATHLHLFFGNTGVDAYSTSSSIANSGGSTCSGGTANRSAYWAPAMIDTRNGSPVLPWDDPVPWLADNGAQVYYKTGYLGVPSASVQNPPTGLRIVAGSANRTTRGNDRDPSSPRYGCNVKGGGAPYNTGFDLNRNCRPGDLLVMTIQFPQCWNGRDLDSPDHQSHMAYGTWGPVFGRNGAGCPSTHPVALPEVTINVHYEVPAGGTSTWRLSSDVYDGPAGYSGHADWWNGWDRDVFQQVVDNCYRPGLNCQMNLLGNGRALN